jgi:predicted homoserine dehydrogenase-like protein
LEGCRLIRDVAKGAVVTYDDVKLPAGRLADTLREEQDGRFASVRERTAATV